MPNDFHFDSFMNPNPMRNGVNMVNGTIKPVTTKCIVPAKVTSLPGKSCGKNPYDMETRCSMINEIPPHKTNLWCFLLSKKVKAKANITPRTP